jgi:hypothetical protein
VTGFAANAGRRSAAEIGIPHASVGTLVLFVVPGSGADAEADWPLCSATGRAGSD